ncbi:hypothetical protein AVHY2522_24325 [Acidovorax sp. SUPP2522]|uniref:ornithine cyclodeaminase n=1 Tax=unclassified Acidovorax TaxID=2684926 RepID=UPI002349E75D|nr:MULTISPECIES: ornithine cyclodeaminase [unclassified Acidovorax]WCM96135.1 ornithine cyclodeaminase [Acidovorax sp. GBBC 1281]GKT19944.1 hypothetical protein AVHY2522_24325 [Acidovorax sp. SUPP2522]
MEFSSLQEKASPIRSSRGERGRDLSDLVISDRDRVMQELIDFRAVGTVVRRALLALAEGTAKGAKAVLQPDDSEIISLIGHETLDARFRDERLNWKLNALISTNAAYGAVKIVGSNAYNRTLGLPRSRSTILLYDKLTMQPLSIMDGTQISARRTGAYASVVVDITLQHKDRLTVFLYGTGPIAATIIDDLHAHHGHRIDKIFVKSRSIETAASFAKCAEQRTRLPIEAVVSDDQLANADLVITASNARNPLFNAGSLSDDIVVLNLGGDETPAEFIRHSLEAGTVICDDIKTVCHRNSQSLSLYFSRQNLRLEESASTYRILNFSQLLTSPSSLLRKPVFVTCVGLPVLDLYVAQWIYEHPMRNRRHVYKAAR